MERIIDLYDDMAIYKANVDEFREQDKNARVMNKLKFDQLKANIAEDKKLESLPLAMLIESSERKNELLIISGHHRVRAARMANIKEIFAIVYEKKLSKDEITAKQLSHNALNGEDNKQILKELYDSIGDVNEKIKSGVIDIENIKMDSVNLSEVNIDFEFEQINILFLSSGVKKFETALDKIQLGNKIKIAQFKEFDQFKEAIKRVTNKDDIRSIAAIITKMSEIVIEYYEGKEKKDG